MQLTAKLKNKTITWSVDLKPRVGSVVTKDGSYYSNISGINSDVSNNSHWVLIFAAPIVPGEVDKTAADIIGSDPNFRISLSADGILQFPRAMSVYIDIHGSNEYQQLSSVIYDPIGKIISGMNSPIDFPDQRIKITWL